MYFTHMLCSTGLVGVIKCIYFADNSNYLLTTHALFTISNEEKKRKKKKKREE